MTKFFKSLLPLLIFASSAWAYSNKTFLMPRAQGVNLAMEYTTWNKLIQKHSKYKNGCNFDITTFYQQSTQSDDLGKYFGVKNKNIINFMNSDELETCYDINSRFILHQSEQQRITEKASIKLDPKTTSFGVRMDLYQNLDEVVKGLYAKINLPFVYIKNDMRLSICNVSSSNEEQVSNRTIFRKFNDYFAGKYFTNIDNLEDRQVTLDSAKIGEAKSAAGLADMDIVLGYRIFRTKCGFAGLNIGVTVPTGNTVEGTDLFEPIYGNGQHFGLGLGFDSKVKFFRKDDSYFKLMVVANYRYLFEGTEKRTIGLQCLKNPNFAHYYLVGKVGDAYATPAANILTRNVEVTPGSQFDGIIGLAYTNGGFVFDLGYNIFWRDSEEIELKDTDFCKDNGNYALVSPDKDFTNPLANAADNWVDKNLDNVDTFEDAYKISIDNFDLNVCKNPSYLTHKIYGGVGYIMKKCNKLMLGLGGSYEFADDNNEIENWAVWFKTGFAF